MKKPRAKTLSGPSRPLSGSEDSNKFFWLGLAALGVISLGMVFLFVLAKKFADRHLPGGIHQPPMLTPSTLPLMLPAPVNNPSLSEAPPPRDMQSSSASTYSLASDSIARIAGAYPNHVTDVVISVVNPASGAAMVSPDPAVVRQASASYPIGNLFVVAAGESQRFRLRPKESLYAKGVSDGVMISVTVSEARV